MAIIAPSILSADFTRLGEELESMRAMGVRVVHIDIMDGNFVPNITFGYTMLEALKAHKGDMLFDVHLMLLHPMRYIDSFIAAGADMLTVHAECKDNVSDCLRRIRAAGIEAGISIKPSTGISKLRKWAGLFDLCLIMTVEPGFGGQSIIYPCLDKIGSCKRMLSRKGIEGVRFSVDGGVNAENAARVRDAGADIIVAGSAVFGAESPKEAFEGLSAEVK